MSSSPSSPQVDRSFSSAPRAGKPLSEQRASKQQILLGVVRAAALSSCTCLLVLVACDGDSQRPTGPAEPVASLELAPATAVLGVGDTLRLLATARDAEGRALVYRAFRWSSSDTTVASVDWTGLVTGLALGSSEIVASREGVSDTATIEVVEGVVAYLFISPESARVEAAGDTLRLRVRLLDVHGRRLRERKPTWASSDTTEARVDSTGLVTGVRVGSAMITAAADSVSAGSEITVVVPVFSLTVEPESVAMKFGWTVQLSAVARDSAGNVLSDREVSWSSSEPSVAHVDSTGLVLGVGVGPAAIVGAAGRKRDTSSVVITPLTFTSVVTGQWFSCALDTVGEAYCWGNPFDGQFSIAGFDARAMPRPVPGHLILVSLSAGLTGGHVCGLTAVGYAYCWGGNGDGQLGDGTRTTSATPVRVAGGLAFASVSAGRSHTCGVTTEGEAYCWGLDRDGQLGNGPEGDSSVPVHVAGELTFETVSAGGGHTCGVTSEGAAYCWGANSYGQLGTGDEVYHSVPVHVSGGLSFVSVSAGQRLTCGLATNGRAHCWGANWHGELGTGDTQDRATPTQVVGGLTFRLLSRGYRHECGLTTDGAYCWGYNSAGQLGTTGGSYVPVRVVGQQ